MGFLVTMHICDTFISGSTFSFNIAHETFCTVESTDTISDTSFKLFQQNKNTINIAFNYLECESHLNRIYMSLFNIIKSLKEFTKNKAAYTHSKSNEFTNIDGISKLQNNSSKK